MSYPGLKTLYHKFVSGSSGAITTLTIPAVAGKRIVIKKFSVSYNNDIATAESLSVSFGPTGSLVVVWAMNIPADTAGSVGEFAPDLVSDPGDEAIIDLSAIAATIGLINVTYSQE